MGYSKLKNQQLAFDKLSRLKVGAFSENQLYSLYVTKSTKNTIPVIAKDKNTLEPIKEFESMALASKWLIESNKTKDKYCYCGISKCCKHKIPSYMGYIWRYKEEVKNNV